MTRPEEPADDRAMPPPADPWATIDRPAATVYLGGPGATADFGPPSRAAHPAGPTADFRPPSRAAHPAGPTADFRPPSQAAHPAGPTADFRPPSQAAHPAGPTADFRPPSQAAHPAGPTADFRPPSQAAHPLGPTGHVPPTGPTVYQGASAPTVRAHEELRFGPGVPPHPVAPPGWPATAPAGRRRPRWRRLVSVLSGLLTLALVVVVGLYLWQRLRPLEVQSATVAVPRPAGNRCDVTVDVVATVRTNGRGGVLRYQWFRSDAPPGALLTEQVGSGQRTATLTLKWTFSGVGTTTETATINITEPSPLQAGTQVAYRCRRR